jgi:hypothetical protein
MQNVFELGKCARPADSDKYNVPQSSEKYGMTDERGDLVPLHYRDGSHISRPNPTPKYTQNTPSRNAKTIRL